jgi:hypothetical protein
MFDGTTEEGTATYKASSSFINKIGRNLKDGQRVPGRRQVT